MRAKLLGFFPLSVAAVALNIGLASPAMSQSLTQTAGFAYGLVQSRAYVPPPCDCDYYTQQCDPEEDLADEDDIDPTEVWVVVHQALDTGVFCGDTASTNMGSYATNDIPGQVDGFAAVIAAFADNMGEVSHLPGNGGVGPFLRATASKTYTTTPPPGGLGPNEVLVFHGSVNVQIGGDGPIAGFANATGPGVDLGAAMFQVNGQVVDVLEGTTTTYSLSKGGLNTSFSEIVGGSFEIAGDCTFGITQVLHNNNASGESIFHISGELMVVDETTLPPMTHQTKFD